MTTAAIYCRVSTLEQAEEGFSIPAQVKQLTDYCKKNDISVYKVYIDEGVSGQKEERPQFQQMIKDAEKKLFNIILVHKFDRFARKVELSHRIKAQLKKAGVNVISMTEPVEDSPIGFFQEGILELLAEYYVRNLAKETKKGHIERASQGLHNGSVPFGYKLVNGDMVVNKEQADIVKLIFDLYLNKGWGSTKIAVWLNQNNIKSAVAGNWAHFTVSRVLKNVKYIGKILYDGQVYDGKHEALIEEEAFRIVQNTIVKRTWKREYRGVNFPKYLLLGFLRCGECGKVFTLRKLACRPNKKKDYIRAYYCCNNYSHVDARHPCDFGKIFRTEDLEKKVLAYIKKQINDRKIILSVKSSVNISDIFDNRESKINSALSRAKQAYLEGIFTLAEYSNEKNRLENELKELQANKDSRTSDVQISDKVKANAKTMWEEFVKAETIPEKKMILGKFVSCVYMYKDRIEVEYLL